MSDDINKVLDKVRKLVALAQGGATEAEAETAMQRVHELLARHNLSMDDVTENEEGKDEVTSDEQKARYNEHWRKVCMMAAAELYFCKYLFQRTTVPGKNTNRRQAGVIHIFIGKPHNAAVAKMMGEYLQNTVTRLANEGAKQYYGSPTSAERNKFHRNFNLGAAERLYERAKEQRRMAERGEAKDSDGRNLPALRSMYEHELSLAQRYIEDKWGGSVRKTKSRTQVKDQAIYDRGRTAGDSISLSTQVGTGRATKAIGGGQ